MIEIEISKEFNKAKENQNEESSDKIRKFAGVMQRNVILVRRMDRFAKAFKEFKETKDEDRHEVLEKAMNDQTLLLMKELHDFLKESSQKGAWTNMSIGTISDH